MTLPAAARAALPSAAAPGGALQALDDRLSQVEAFGTQVSAAIDQLVNALLELKEGQAPAPAAAPAAEIAALQAKVKELEQQLNLERACRDLAKVSQMHPKERRVVFVGTLYFGDNVKYAWAACQERAKDLGIDCWFLPYNAEQEALVRSLGGQVLPVSYAQWTPEQVHAVLSTAVLVTSDHLLNPNPYAAAMLAGARHVQLWHGVSIKEIGLRNLAGGRALGPHFARVLATCGDYAAMVATSAAAEAEWRRWFAFERFAPVGYPRNDVLHREPTRIDLANVDLDAYERARGALADGRRVFLYAPTFRDADKGRWLLDVGLDRIAQAVLRNGDCLIVNLHPVEQQLIPQLQPQLPDVVFVQPRTDCYPLLRQTTALITDYSSVMFDYLQLDRPILLFRPDHERYTERSRKLFDDKLKELPGPMFTDAGALLAQLKRPDLGQQPRHAQARRALLNTHYDAADGRSGERVVELLCQELERAGC
jgi:CDP-glycerol glycerophosphotransferase